MVVLPFSVTLRSPHQAGNPYGRTGQSYDKQDGCQCQCLDYSSHLISSRVLGMRVCLWSLLRECAWRWHGSLRSDTVGTDGVTVRRNGGRKGSFSVFVAPLLLRFSGATNDLGQPGGRIRKSRGKDSPYGRHSGLAPMLDQEQVRRSRPKVRTSGSYCSSIGEHVRVMWVKDPLIDHCV